ncbi:hypothetical protein Acsp02_86390 [Actinoplanes sp. NBRC 103695]|nr:hypothetical protein Acsp02_86390 [Actinoplanes sp. NBRC 103695]
MSVSERTPTGKVGDENKMAFRLAAHLFGGQLTVAICAFLVNLLSSRVMGPSGRGELAFYLQVSYVLGVIGLAGLDRAYPARAALRNTLAVGSSEFRRLVKPSLIMALLSAATIALALDNGSVGALVVAAALALVTFGNCLTGGLRAVCTVASSGRSFLTTSLAAQISLASIATGLSLAGEKSTATWLGAYAICITVPPTIFLWAIKADKSKTAERNPTSLRRIRRLGLALMPSSLASIIATRSDRIMLPWMASYQQLGLYVVVATVCEMAQWPLQAWIDAHAPAWHRAFIAGNLRPFRKMCHVAVLAVPASAAVYLGCRFAVLPLFGDAYSAAANLILPLSAASALLILSRCALGLAVAMGSSTSPLISDTCAMVVAVTAYVLMIPSMGALGAAWGSLLSYCTAAVVSISLCAIHGRRAHSRFVSS